MTPTEAIQAICPILDAAISVERKNRDLFTLQDTIYNLQIALYWFQSAEEDYNKLLEEVLEPSPKVSYRSPTLISNEESFDYICKGLTKITDSVSKYIEEVPLSQTLLNKIQQGNNRLMEAYFTTELTAKYEQQSRGRS